MHFLRSALRKFKVRLKYYFSGLYHRVDSNHGFLMASGLTFSIFTCIVPLVLVIFSIVGILLESPHIKDQIIRLIETVVPYQKSSHYIEEVILDRLNQFRIFRTFTGSLGIFGLLFAASGLFSSMTTILNTIFKITEGKNIIVSKLRDFKLVGLVVLFFILYVLILPLLNIAVSFVNKIGILSHFYQIFASVILAFISFVLIFTIFFWIYYYIPYQKLGKKVVALSALWSAVLWEIAKEVFGYYIAHAVTLNRVYGTYVFIVVIAFWIYYSSVVFIIGAEIGQLYRERKERRAKGAGTADHLVT
ncbi:MAG: YihY/virulence factor BrkB family protein [Calditrichia bacterium]